MNKKRILIAASAVAVAGAAAFLTYHSFAGRSGQAAPGIVDAASAEGQRTERLPELAQGVTPRPSLEAGSYRMPDAGQTGTDDKPKKQ